VSYLKNKCYLLCKSQYTLYCRLWQDSGCWWTYINDICSFTSVPYSVWTAEGILTLPCQLLLKLVLYILHVNHTGCLILCIMCYIWCFLI